MSFRIPALRRKPKFVRTARMADTSQNSASQHSHDHGHDHDHSNCQHDHHHHHHPEETEEEYAEPVELPPVPSLYTALPPIKDTPETESSRIQDETVEALLPFLSLSQILDPSADINSHGVPKLRRENHLRYLKFMLESRYPKQFVILDPSRPWTFYWCLNGMTMLGKDISEYKERYDILIFTTDKS
jgi:hypothetical protein